MLVSGLDEHNHRYRLVCDFLLEVQREIEAVKTKVGMVARGRLKAVGAFWKRSIGRLAFFPQVVLRAWVIDNQLSSQEALPCLATLPAVRQADWESAQVPHSQVLPWLWTSHVHRYVICGVRFNINGELNTDDILINGAHFHPQVPASSVSSPAVSACLRVPLADLKHQVRSGFGYARTHWRPFL